MGLFSGIGRLVKKVFSGIKKVFNSVMKFIGKITGSKWGKIFMIGLTIFTLGTALMAGIQGFAGTTGSFLTKFVAGAKDFMTAFMNPFKAAKNMASGLPATERAAQAAAQGADLIAGGTGVAQSPGDLAAGGGQMGPPSPGGIEKSGGTQIPTPPSPAAPSGPTGAPPQMGPPSPVPENKLLSMAKNLGTGIKDFAQSSGGGLLLANLAKSMGEGGLLEHEWEERRRVDRAWHDPQELSVLRETTARGIRSPQRSGAQNADRLWQIRNNPNYAPNVSFSNNRLGG